MNSYEMNFILSICGGDSVRRSLWSLGRCCCFKLIEHMISVTKQKREGGITCCGSLRSSERSSKAPLKQTSALALHLSTRTAPEVRMGSSLDPLCKRHLAQISPMIVVPRPCATEPNSCLPGLEPGSRLWFSES
jgi:hypothetical protein